MTSALSPVEKGTNEKYTAQQVADALLAAKGLVTVAARTLHCDPKTVDNYAKRYVMVREAKQQAREGILDMTEARLFQAIDKGEPWAIAMMLRTLGKDRGYVERTETDVRGKLTVESAAQMTDAEMEAEGRKRGLW